MSGLGGVGGVSGLGGCAWSGGCVWSGGCAWSGGGLPQCLVGYHHPTPVNRMTNRCKNITLATASLRPVKMGLLLSVSHCYF